MSQDNSKALINCKEAAEYLGFSESRIRYETFLKRIPHIKMGRSVFYKKAQLDQWIQDNSKGTEND